MVLRSLISSKKFPFGGLENMESHESNVTEDKRERALVDLQEMFSSSLEPEVVKLILSESDYDVNAALEQLFTLSGSQETCTEQPANSVIQMDDIKQTQTSRHGHHLDSTHTDSSVNSGSLLQGRVGIGVVSNGEAVAESNKERSNPKHRSELIPVKLPSTTSSSEKTCGFVLQNEKVGGSDHDDCITSGVAADNSQELFPVNSSQRPSSKDPPSSGLGKFQGSLEHYLKHVLTTGSTLDSEEWNSNAVSNGQFSQTLHSKPSTTTNSKYDRKETKTNTLDHTFPKLPHCFSSNSLQTDFHNSDLVKPMHRKDLTSDHSHAERKSVSNNEKRQFNPTVKLNHNPPEIQRCHLAPNFGGPIPKGNSLVGPHGDGILGYGPSGDTVQGPPVNFSRGTTWAPHSFNHRPPLLPTPRIQQLRHPSPKPGMDAATQPGLLKVSRVQCPLAKALIIMRGLPGSGKTTLARKLNKNGVTLSTDDFFMRNGRYEFDGAKLGQAHERTRKQAKAAMEKGITPLIIDNTNTTAQEMKPYVSMGKSFGYTVVFKEPDTWWKFNPEELARRNQHRVGFPAIARMLTRYERFITVAQVMQSSQEAKGESTKGAENCPDKVQELSPKPHSGDLKVSERSLMGAPFGVREVLGTEQARAKCEEETLKPQRSPNRSRKAVVNGSENMKTTDHSAGTAMDSVGDHSPLLVDLGDYASEEMEDTSVDEEQDRLSHQPYSYHQIQRVNLPQGSSSGTDSGSEHTVSKRNPAGLSENQVVGNTASVTQSRNSFQGMPAVSYEGNLTNENCGFNRHAGKRVPGKITIPGEANDIIAVPDASNEAAMTSVSDEKDSNVMGIEFLRTCFPDIDYSIMESLLLLNDGDVVKTVETILASIDENTPKDSSTVSMDLPRNEASLPRNTESLSSSLHPSKTLPRDDAPLLGNTECLGSSLHHSKTLPRNDAPLLRNTESLGSSLHPIGVLVPGCSGVPDFPDSFTYGGASGAFATDRLQHPPMSHPDQSRDHLPWSSETSVSGEPTTRVPGMPSASARALEPSRVQDMTTKESVISAMDDVPSFVDQTKEADKSACDKSCFQLSLEPAIAFQLIEMFGPVAGLDFTDELLPEDLVVNVDSAFATSLYKEWEKTMHAIQTPSTVTGGQVPTVVSSPKNSPGQKQTRKPRRLMRDKDISPNWEDGRKKGNKQLKMDPFRDIMDEQLAIELSRKNKAKRDAHVDTAAKDLATHLNRKKLYSMFPGIDPVALDELFESNRCRLGPTVEMVQASCGISAAERPPVTVASAFVRQKGEQEEEKATEQLTKEDESFLCSQDGETLLQSVPVVPNSFQTLKDPDYRDFRAEAQAHYEQRGACFKKAALAFSKKQVGLADLYTRQAHEHTQKMKEANARAAAMIMQQRNINRGIDDIDLHGLHVSEALQVLEEMLTAWKPAETRDPFSKPSPKVITVVTGRGIHSRGGKARIKPAVLEYLRRNNYSFTELNAGLVQVTLT